MAKSSEITILGPGVSFIEWEADVQAALVKRGRLAHVFHNIDGIIPALRPVLLARVPNQKEEEYKQLEAEYQKDLSRWVEGEIEAKNILIKRMSATVRPQTIRTMTAKQLFDHVAASREEGATVPYETAVRNLHNTKFTTNAEDYCDRFMQSYLSVNNAAESMRSHLSMADPTVNPFSILPGYASSLFVLGTEKIEWLDTWRQTKIFDSSNHYVSLEVMMATLRQAVAGREQTTGSVFAAAGACDGFEKKKKKNGNQYGDPDEICQLCKKHRHKNKECFKQHPELKTKFSKKGKFGKGKAAVKAPSKCSSSDDSDSEEHESNTDSDSDAGLRLANVARASCINKKKNPLLYDTGASHHFVRSKSKFVNLVKLSRPFKFDQAIGTTALTHQGTTQIKIGNKVLKLSESLYSPNSMCNIISAVRLKKEHGIVAASENELLVETKTKVPIARLVEKDGVLFIKPLSKDKNLQNQNIVAPGVARLPRDTNAQRWHQRLGHTSQQILKKTAQFSLGMEGIDFADLTTCEACHLSKAQRFISREPRPIPGEPLDEVSIDTVGKLTASINGYQYAVIITDAKTRMRWVITTKEKDVIAEELVKWIEYQQHQYGKKIRIIFKDGGTEFSRIKEYCEKNHIRTDTSAPYTPEQNGVSEASNKVILRRARSMLIDARMPPCFWPWAVEHSCFVTNRLYCLRTKMVPLVDFLHGLKQPHNNKIDLSFLPRFGCRAYKLIQPKPSTKFEARAEKGWFFGFQKNTNKNFLIYHPHSTPKQSWKWVESVSPHVTFDENIMFGDMLSDFDKQKTISYWSIGNTTKHVEQPQFTHEALPPNQSQSSPRFEGEPSSSSGEHDPSTSPPPNTPIISDEHWPKQSDKLDELATLTDLIPSTDNQDQFSEPFSPVISESDNQIISLQNDDTSLTERTSTQNEDSPFQQNQGESGPLVGPIDEDQPRYDQIMTGWDEVRPIAGHKRNRSTEPTTTRSKRGRPIIKLDYHRMHHGKAARPTDEPKTWSEAMSSTEAIQWHEAALEEIRSLKKTGTIEVIKRDRLPKGRTLMKSKWVFKKKYLADGSLDKYKARCTVKGFTQRSGIDYQETFAPTPRAETGRIMLVLAHRFGWHRRQGDVPTAFLNPDLDVDLYMEMPEGFKKENHIILIRKGLYGLKQAAALWYDDARSTLANLGLFPTISDVCLYTNKHKDLFVLLHVDDFQVMGPNLKKIDKLMQALHKKYKLKTVNTNLFLGIHISNPNKHTLKLSQGQYARKLLERHGLKDCKSANSPIERLLESNSTQSSAKQKKEFNSIIGGLQYLANNTRPDIAYAVNHLARFLVNPSVEHIHSARRVLRYISKNPDQGITFVAENKMPALEAYSDADFAGDPSTSRSTSGSLIYLASGPVSWKSHLQKEVVLSTTEAEYLAATETCRQLQWVKSLLQELSLHDRVEGVHKTKLFVDNQSAISLIKNHDNHKRSKHIALRNFYCRQQFYEGAISVVYVQSDKQLADSLTKPKSSVKIQ